MCLELYKVLQKKAVEDFRNTFANLAVPLFAMSEPLPPKAFKFQDMSWTLWDRWVLEGDLSVQDVLEWFRVRLRACCAPAEWAWSSRGAPADLLERLHGVLHGFLQEVRAQVVG